MDREVNWGSVYQDDMSKRKILEDILPWNQKYRVASFEVIQENDIPCEVKFKASLMNNECLVVLTISLSYLCSNIS